jgi:hypothetical protein
LKIPFSARGTRAGTNMRRPAHRGPPTLRPRSGQPCALCRLGGLRACATARRTRVRLRVASRAIRRQSAAVCSAAAPTEAARGHSGRVRRHGLRLSSGASSRNRAASASSRRGAARRIPRYVVGGIPPPRLACAPRPPRRTIRLRRASAGLRALEAASPAAKEFFFVSFFHARGTRAGAKAGASLFVLWAVPACVPTRRSHGPSSSAFPMLGFARIIGGE